MGNIAKDFAQIIKQSKDTKAGPYDTQAIVKRVEGNTVWVSIPGGVDETPIDKTVNCSAGDKVQVRVSGGRAWITGNASAPPTDDKTANEAKTKAVVAEATAIDAKATADSVEGIAVNASATAVTAKAIAEGVNEHFWHDSTGAHVTEVTQEEWNEPTDPNYHSGGNTLITTQGMAIRDGLTNLAEFGSSGATIGEVADDNIRVNLSSDAFRLINRRSNTDVEETHIGYGEVQGGSGPTNGMLFSFGRRDFATLDYDDYPGHNWKVGDLCIHNGKEYACISDTTGVWDSSKWCLSIGKSSLASGDSPTAAGPGSVAFNSTALGIDSFATGTENIAVGVSQTVIGQFNAPTGTPDSRTTSDPAFIIGNGTADNARSNALAVKWSGDVEAAGDIEDGSGNVLSNKIESSYLAVSSTAIYSGQSISGGGYVSATSHALTPPDNVHTWKALSVAGWSINQHNVRFSSCYIDGNASVFCGLHNDATGTLSVNLSIYVLWIRTA